MLQQFPANTSQPHYPEEEGRHLYPNHPCNLNCSTPDNMLGLNEEIHQHHHRHNHHSNSHNPPPHHHHSNNNNNMSHNNQPQNHNQIHNHHQPPHRSQISHHQQPLPHQPPLPNNHPGSQHFIQHTEQPLDNMPGDMANCGMYGSCNNMNSNEYNNNTSGSDVELGEPSVCAGCSGKIDDRYFLVAVDKQWHVSCLRCTECHVPLDSELTCFSKDGQIYCKEDYYRKFAVRGCSRCRLPISSQELVMRARDLVYHVNCFACASCNTVLNTGEQFGIRDNLIFCKHHYEVLSPGEFPSPPSHGIMGDMVNPIGGQGYPFPGVSPPSKGRPRKKKNQSHVQDLDAFSGLIPEEIGPDGYPLSNSARQKRIRTSFKHHQLRILKSYFALNQNPDAKDLKQLSQKTGLTKRVLQVWFQNARAKYRRNLLKDSNGNVSTKDSMDDTSPKSPSDNTQASFSSDLNDDCSRSSDPMGDLGSPTSLMDMQGGGVLDHEGCSRGGGRIHLGTSSISELYSNSVNAMN